MITNINNLNDLLKHFGQPLDNPMANPNQPINDTFLVPVKKEGYLYTLGDSKAQVVFMKLIQGLPHIGKVLKQYYRFREIISLLQNNPFKQYIITLVYQDAYNKGSKYLATDKQKTYFNNILKTELSKAFETT